MRFSKSFLPSKMLHLLKTLLKFAPREIQGLDVGEFEKVGWG